MKIDLSIQDATPEEVARILLAASAHIKVPIALNETRPPVTAPPVVVVHAPEKKEAKEVSPNRVKSAQDARANEWGFEELALLSKYLDDKKVTAAWKAYRKEFPASTRNRRAVYQRWNILKNEAKAAKKIAQKGPAKQGATTQVLKHPEIATGLNVRQITAYRGEKMHGTGVVTSRKADIAIVRNGGRKTHEIPVECLELVSGPEKTAEPDLSKCNLSLTAPGEWTEPEDAAIRDCPNEEAALARFLEKFPDSERTAVDVAEHWKLIHVPSAETVEAAP